jgi:hypothetical protein
MQHSTIINGQLFKRTYIGYTKRQAQRLFNREVKAAQSK